MTHFSLLWPRRKPRSNVSCPLAAPSSGHPRREGTTPLPATIFHPILGLRGLYFTGILYLVSNQSISGMYILHLYKN